MRYGNSTPEWIHTCLRARLFTRMPPTSAYIHVPFCTHRCGYCNFTLVAGRDDLVKPYLDALSVELSWLEKPREVKTLYFGGGTPTYLSVDNLEKLCELVLHWHPLQDNYEWTVEANPGDLDRQRMQTLAHYGVNRISLGAQSFRSQKLALLERDHLAEDILEAVWLVREAGMKLSLDLIFATPGETLQEWQDDLTAVLELEPEHISTYGLTFERGTTFWSRLHRGELSTVPEELDREMYLAAIDLMTAARYQHYEISNFGKPSHLSRHNEVYWEGKGYYAAGPGAARYVDGVRSTNHRSTFTYLKRIQVGKSPLAEQEQLNPEQRAREMLVFGLRRIAGVDRQDFSKRSGYTVEDLSEKEIAHFVQHGLLTANDQNVRLTQAGLLVSDSMWPHLL